MADARALTGRALWLTAAALLLALFALDAWAVTGGLTRGFDQRALAWLRDPGDARALRVPHWTVWTAIGVTTLGGWTVRGPIAAAGAIGLALTGRRRQALIFALAVAGAAAALPLVKALFARARPDLMWQLVVERHPSFPSGHAMGAGLTYPLLGFLVGRRRWLVAAGIGLALLIGLSRAFLGVHWASDVIGGWLLGGAWACATVAILGNPSNVRAEPVEAPSFFRRK